jgi:CBS domain-containing protein
MRVQEIMSRGVQIADPNMTIRDAARQMRAENLGALPVAQDGGVIGMVTDRDIAVRAVAADRHGGNTTVREVMSQGAWYCFQDDDVEQAAETMAKHQVRRLPVLDREKRLIGFVTLADLARSQEHAADDALKGICEPTEKERR